jgi:uncharacterized Tic20 family protein
MKNLPSPEKHEVTALPYTGIARPIDSPMTGGERLWGTLAHLCGLLWLSGFPFAGPIASFIVYVTKRHLSPYVAEQTREAQNFQNTISVAVVIVVAFAGAFVGADMWASLQSGQMGLDNGHATTELMTIMFLCLALAAIMTVNVLFCIIAAIAAYRGEEYRYPVCIRWLHS